jgi:hypothetical protein
MRTLRSVWGALGLAAALAAGVAVAQEAPPLVTELAMEGGKVKLKAPDWPTTRSEPTVAVFEKPKTDTDAAFYVLVVAAEAGPAGDTIAWDEIRANIEKAATTGGSTLKFELKGDWTQGPAGSKGQRMAGTLEVQKQSLSAELVCVVQHGRMVTVSVMGLLDKPGLAIALAVAKTVAITE